MKDEVLRRFAEGRVWAAGRAPYLASALFALRPVVLEPRVDEVSGELVADAEFRAFPADTRWRVYLDPGTALNTSAEEVGWWLLHHIGHLVRRHAARAPGSSPHWAQAADAEVNDDLEAGAPAGVVSPRALGLPEGRMAEEYLSLIEVLDAAHRRGGRPLAELIDCGSASDGVERPYEDSGAGEGLNEVERELLELAIAREIENRAAGRSPVGGGWRRWAGERLRPAVDWRAQLGAVVRRGVRQAAGRVDFSYRRPARRPGVNGVVLPAMVAPAPEIVLVVDTSGSIPPGTLARFLAEITALVTRAGGPARRFRVICCDLHAHPVQTVRRAEEVELTGGGGTDLREGIAAAVALRPRPDLIVVLTDGQTPWPEHRPPVPVLVGLTGTEPPPSWARTVSLPT